MQSAYRILVASNAEALDASDGDLWDSGKVFSARTPQIEYEGRPLVARQQLFWKARVWDDADAPSAWECGRPVGNGSSLGDGLEGRDLDRAGGRPGTPRSRRAGAGCTARAGPRPRAAPAPGIPCARAGPPRPALGLRPRLC